MDRPAAQGTRDIETRTRERQAQIMDQNSSRKLEHLKETLPNLYSEDALPYKVFNDEMDTLRRPAGRTRPPSAEWRVHGSASCPTPTITRGSPNGSPPTCPSANGSSTAGLHHAPPFCQAPDLRQGQKDADRTPRRPIQVRSTSSTHAPTTTRRSAHAARNKTARTGMDQAMAQLPEDIA